MEDHLSMNNIATIRIRERKNSRSTESIATDILDSRLLSPASSLTNKGNRDVTTVSWDAGTLPGRIPCPVS